MQKKYWKLMPKVIKNDAKMDTKIDQFSNFSENGWNARNYLFYNRKRGSEHIKIQEKSIQNRCKIDTRKSDAKSMENDAKMHPKWRPKSDQNLNKAGKNGIRKLMPKFDAKQKSQNVSPTSILIDFGSIFWPCRGVRGAEDTWKYRIDSNSLTRSPPRRGAADQNGSQNRC